MGSGARKPQVLWRLEDVTKSRLLSCTMPRSMRTPVLDSIGAPAAALRWRRAVAPATARRWLALLDAHEGGSVPLAGVLDIDEVLRALAPRLRPALGGDVDLLVSQCWGRRARPPHSWHQDGGLHAAFTEGETLLPVFTCWLTLTDCGVDAPSLQWIEPPLAALLAPQELTDGAVRARHDPAAFKHGVFQAGDALAFGGGLLHRTHLTPHMHQPRTSLELRFVDSRLQTPRLAGETRRPAFV